jgi:hypothetical protein
MRDLIKHNSLITNNTYNPYVVKNRTITQKALISLSIILIVALGTYFLYLLLVWLFG